MKQCKCRCAHPRSRSKQTQVAMLRWLLANVREDGLWRCSFSRPPRGFFSGMPISRPFCTGCVVLQSRCRCHLYQTCRRTIQPLQPAAQLRPKMQQQRCCKWRAWDRVYGFLLRRMNVHHLDCEVCADTLVTALRAAGGKPDQVRRAGRGRAFRLASSCARNQITLRSHTTAGRRQRDWQCRMRRV